MGLWDASRLRRTISILQLVHLSFGEARGSLDRRKTPTLVIAVNITIHVLYGFVYGISTLHESKDRLNDR